MPHVFGGAGGGHIAIVVEHLGVLLRHAGGVHREQQDIISELLADEGGFVSLDDRHADLAVTHLPGLAGPGHLVYPGRLRIEHPVPSDGVYNVLKRGGLHHAGYPTAYALDDLRIFDDGRSGAVAHAYRAVQYALGHAHAHQFGYSEAQEVLHAHLPAFGEYAEVPYAELHVPAYALLGELLYAPLLVEQGTELHARLADVHDHAVLHHHPGQSQDFHDMPVLRHKRGMNEGDIYHPPA